MCTEMLPTLASRGPEIPRGFQGLCEGIVLSLSPMFLTCTSPSLALSPRHLVSSSLCMWVTDVVWACRQTGAWPRRTSHYCMPVCVSVFVFPCSLPLCTLYSPLLFLSYSSWHSLILSMHVFLMQGCTTLHIIEYTRNVEFSIIQ